jgi:hypothetical protein
MNDADLEERLIQGRPMIPEPPSLARDRARRAALAALPTRRLRRGWVLAVAAAVVLGALTVPPALGVGGSLLDLLPLGGEKEEEFLRGACEASAIRVTFDPAKGAAVTSGDETLAFAGFGRLEVAGSCTPLPTPANEFASLYPDSAYEDLPKEGVYQAVTLTCTVPGTVELYAHPIWDGYVGRVGGSVLLVLRGDPPRVLVSAVLKKPEPTAVPGTGRIYYVSGACRTG